MYVIHKTNGQVLAHHGILGQKWGVRRFQNADGSLTPAGRDRYGMTKKDKRKLAIDLRGVGEKESKKATERAKKNPFVQKAISDYKAEAKALSGARARMEQIRDQFDAEPDHVMAKYAKPYIDRMIKDLIDGGSINPDNPEDKEYISETYKMRTDLSVESEEVYEGAFDDWLRDKGLMKEYSDSVSANVKLYNMAKNLANDILGEYGSMSIGTAKNTTQVDVSDRLGWIIGDMQ